MRIISGTARGTKLYTLEGETTRPTLDRVKESLFNIINGSLYNGTFLDLFSGSGAIGLEAASRGCKRVYLCEKDRNAIGIIRKNIEKTHLENKVELHHMSFDSFLKNKLNDVCDIVFIDPPYKTDYVKKSIEILIDKKLVNEDSLIIVETDEEDRVLREIKDFKLDIIDHRKYGRCHLIFIKYKND